MVKIVFYLFNISLFIVILNHLGFIKIVTNKLKLHSEYVFKSVHDDLKVFRSKSRIPI